MPLHVPMCMNRLICMMIYIDVHHIVMHIIDISYGYFPLLIMRHLDAIMVSISTTCIREKFASNFHRNVQGHMPLLGFNRHPYRCNLLNGGALIKDLSAFKLHGFLMSFVWQKILKQNVIRWK